MNRPVYFQKPMQRGLLVLALCLLAGTVHAEWFKFGRSDNFRVYLEQASIQKNGDSAQILQLMDFTTAYWVDAQTVVGSIKNLIEYDCGRPRFRTLASEAYSEQMAAGRLVAQEKQPDPQWQDIEKDSPTEKIRKIACGK